MEHMAIRRRAVTVMLLSLLLSDYLFSQTTVPIQDPSDPHRARVSGTVLNEWAQPVPGITVTATPPGPVGAILPRTQTDAEGRFALAGLLPGHTYVNAFEEKAFYPNASSNFWDGQGEVEIELLMGGEVSGIMLELKPVGRLEVKARNVISGTGIDQIAIKLERDSAPNRWIAGGKLGDWWLVPTGPIRLCVSAEGFEATWYGADGSFQQSAPITLRPRQVFTATVSLRPLTHPAADVTCFSGRSR